MTNSRAFLQLIPVVFLRFLQFHHATPALQFSFPSLSFYDSLNFPSVFSTLSTSFLEFFELKLASAFQFEIWRVARFVDNSSRQRQVYYAQTHTKTKHFAICWIAKNWFAFTNRNRHRRIKPDTLLMIRKSNRMYQVRGVYAVKHKRFRELKRLPKRSKSKQKVNQPSNPITTHRVILNCIVCAHKCKCACSRGSYSPCSHSVCALRTLSLHTEEVLLTWAFHKVSARCTVYFVLQCTAYEVRSEDSPGEPYLVYIPLRRFQRLKRAQTNFGEHNRTQSPLEPVHNWALIWTEFAKIRQQNAEI